MFLDISGYNKKNKLDLLKLTSQANRGLAFDKDVYHKVLVFMTYNKKWNIRMKLDSNRPLLEIRRNNEKYEENF